MNQILSHLARLHAGRDIFEKEAVLPHLPGFRKEWREPKLLEYEEFRHLMYKWHTRLFRVSIATNPQR